MLPTYLLVPSVQSASNMQDTAANFLEA